jgi:hypothetical protein
MEKSKLERFISKYYLGGSIKNAKWQSNGNELSVSCTTDDKNVLAMIAMKEDVLPKGTYGVFDTSMLSSMLSVMGDSLDVVTRETNGKVTALTLSDSNATAEYVLADPSAISGTPELKNLPNFEISIDLDQQFVTSFLRAKSALGEEREFTVVSDGKKTQVIIGYSNNNTHRITLNVTATEAVALSHTNFSASLLKEILVANKGMSGVMKISTKGIAHVSFQEQGYTTNYYLIKI